jgi:hypothetical protein
MLTRTPGTHGQTVAVYTSSTEYEGELIRVDRQGVTLGRYTAWRKDEHSGLTRLVNRGERIKLLWENVDGLYGKELKSSLMVLTEAG